MFHRDTVTGAYVIVDRPASLLSYAVRCAGERFDTYPMVQGAACDWLVTIDEHMTDTRPARVLFGVEVVPDYR